MKNVVRMGIDADGPVSRIEVIALAAAHRGQLAGAIGQMPQHTVMDAEGGDEAGLDGVRLAVQRGLLRTVSATASAAVSANSPDGSPRIHPGPDDAVELTPLGRFALMAASEVDAAFLTGAILRTALEITREMSPARDAGDAAVVRLVRSYPETHHAVFEAAS